MSAGESAHECGLAAGDWRQAAGGGGLCAMLLSFFALVFSRLKAKRGHGASQQRIGRLRDRGRGGGGAADARFGTRHNSVPSCRPQFASSADPSYAGVGADGARIATKKCCVFFFFFLASREPRSEKALLPKWVLQDRDRSCAPFVYSRPCHARAVAACRRSGHVPRSRLPSSRAHSTGLHTELTLPRSRLPVSPHWPRCLLASGPTVVSFANTWSE